MNSYVLRLHRARKEGSLNPKFLSELTEVKTYEPKEPTKEEQTQRAEFFKIRSPKDFFKSGEFYSDTLIGSS